MADESNIALEAISVVKDFVSKGQGGLNYSSDQITYPRDLAQVPEDANSKEVMVANVHKAGSLYASDELTFSVYGQFRAYDQTIIDDPNAIVTPVMANVYIDLTSSEKAGLSELEIHFTALQTPYGNGTDPRIRFLCEGHYDPAGSGDFRFRAVVEIDQNGNVNCLEDDPPRITGGDGVISDDSPHGFDVTIQDGGLVI
jgi:hypothetical protein